MTYEELKIQLDINDPAEVLRSVGRIFHVWWFVVCADGDCHMFDWTGEEHDISQVKCFNEGIVPTDVKRVIMPNGVESIGEYAFSYCHRLESIEIPSSVKYIGDWAFSHCVCLSRISMPASVKKIGRSAFYGCKSLKEVVFKGKTLEQVRAMDYYPWGGIKDVSIIKCI